MAASNESVPRLSIGLAVFNGAAHIRDAIDSILSQSFQDFELILCDNASTDATSLICQEYLDKDHRVRYLRNDKNIGLSPNLNKVFSLASGQYFKWAAHDDFISVDYLQACVEVLDSNPDIVLCQSCIKKVDTNGVLTCDIGDFRKQLNVHKVEESLNSNKVYDRLIALQNEPTGWLQVYGVIRRSCLLKTDLFGGYPEDDHILLVQLALQGRIYTDKQSTFFSRDHSGQSVDIGRRSMHQFAIWLNPEKKGRLIFPQWELVIAYTASLLRFSNFQLTKVDLWLVALSFIRSKLPRLIKDIYISLLQVLDCSVRKLLGSVIRVSSDTPIFGRYPRIEL